MLEFLTDTLVDCREQGYVTTLLGRRRAIQGVRPVPPGLREPKTGALRQLNLPERTAVNAVIQGTAADLIKLAMIRIHRRLREEELAGADAAADPRRTVVRNAARSSRRHSPKLVREEMSERDGARRAAEGRRESRPQLGRVRSLYVRSRYEADAIAYDQSTESLGKPGGSRSLTRAMHAIIGLIGGVASGKVGRRGGARRRGAVVFDADKIGHQVLDEPEVRDELVARWGAGVLDADGRIIAPAVAKHRLRRPRRGGGRAAIPRSNSLHPRIRQRIEAAIRQLPDASVPAVVIDAPLLIEAGWNERLPRRSSFVDCPREQRLRRAASPRLDRRGIRSPRGRPDADRGKAASREPRHRQFRHRWRDLEPRGRPVLGSGSSALAAAKKRASSGFPPPRCLQYWTTAFDIGIDRRVPPSLPGCECSRRRFTAGVADRFAFLDRVFRT